MSVFHRMFLLIFAFTVLLLNGCAARQLQADSTDKGSSVSTSDVSDSGEQESKPLSSETEKSSSEEAETDFASLDGKYVFHTEGVEDIYCPNLVLREDGTCRFNVNLLTNMGAINGSFQVDKGLLITIDVDNLSFDGFVGDDTKRVYFEVAAGDTLMYRGTDAGEDAVIGMTNPMDLFKKE